MFIPCALHGVEASFLSKGSFLKLSAAILRGVWSRRQPLSSAGAVLGMLDGSQECDPPFCLVWYRFRLFRRYLAFWSDEVARVQGGCPGHGPVHALVVSASRIGVQWEPSVPGWRRQGLLGLSNLAGPLQHFRSAVLQSWWCKVSADLCGFRGGPLLDVHVPHQHLTSSRVRER